MGECYRKLKTDNKFERAFIATGSWLPVDHMIAVPASERGNPDFDKPGSQDAEVDLQWVSKHFKKKNPDKLGYNIMMSDVHKWEQNERKEELEREAEEEKEAQQEKIQNEKLAEKKRIQLDKSKSYRDNWRTLCIQDFGIKIGPTLYKLWGHMQGERMFYMKS